MDRFLDGDFWDPETVGPGSDAVKVDSGSSNLLVTSPFPADFAFFVDFDFLRFIFAFWGELAAALGPLDSKSIMLQGKKKVI